ncbi:GntR family transcriptional regulator [Actinokineospora sp. NBRC 105648]|uniref:GntR family transcriptional regulator n=1 Tax=Actinokineospora sp. NBRC 105648 TaxID=3032206 RepID=UPI0024A342C5|nr:GntR family transcriptional regulator [Actinokineospora sp. NBRC 105648]GLZ43525.1 putative transcriptional regulator, GntR family protein [Actinokineospora sp. NBRC 105648]
MTAARSFTGPAYQRIAAEFAQQIDTGQLVDGDRLPTRSQLEETYGVSRQVVAQALALLHQQGYLSSEPSRSGGTFVRRFKVYELPMWSLENYDGQDAFDDAVRNQGGTPHQDIRVETAEPPPRIAESLSLKPGKLVTIRRRIRYVDGKPYALADSYFPHDIVKNTAISSPVNISTGGRHILEDMGYGMTHHDDTIRARRAHADEMNWLNVAPGLAMMVHTRLSVTAEGFPIRFMVSVLPSDRWALFYAVSNESKGLA